ncbi:transglycosylase family protein [Streptomyces ipomoeae]|uniref:LysM peptidoglycan-binding domain-containing protein n=1 Tax=Streptomyces ipomoeae TaxID=103232 RepID=UPI0015EFE296|nr:transglycosylase family protein [Streptomyces ipomoeae]MDX2933125.1 transglycosylase family protein [Streptomyces ipomoeae]
MLSGNGRHRRPRQAPALLVAAGVTGSAIAIPFLGATGASAASGTTWDQVAECESGGSWSADTGNGRYGGLQMSQENWEKYGGLDYATSADQASRSQQIAVAEKILADQGVGVWSTCGLLHNLDGDSGSADVDTGVADDSSSSDGSSSSGGSPDSPNSTKSSSSSDSSESSRSTESSESSETSESSANVAEGSTKADIGSNDSSGSTGSGDGTSQESDSSSLGDTESRNSGESGQNGDSSSGEDAGAGRHRGASADEDAADNSRTESSSSGRHASRGGDSAREAVEAVHASYTVRVGDNLTSIANSLGVQGGWRELYAENERTVGTDPDLILPGQTLEVGAETGEK